MIFNHNAPLLMAYMVVIMLTALLGTSYQFVHNSKKGLSFGGIMLLTFALALFPIQSADFVYHAKMLTTGRNIKHLEDIFIWLWHNTRDVTLWRIGVFAPATLFLWLSVKYLGVNNKFAAFIFVITQMFMFGALRNMLGLMTMYLCVILIFYSVKTSRRMLILFVACAGLLGCIFLHRSMWLYVMLLAVGLIPFGKKIIKISLFAFPVLYASIFFLSTWFLATFADAEMQTHAAYYTDSERATTLMKTINELLKQGAYLYFLYLIIYSFSKKSFYFPPVFKFLTRYSYALIYLGFLFYGQGNGGWLFERFAWTGEISLMFVMMWFLYLYPRKNNVKIALGILIYTIVYQILYICTYASAGYIERFNSITL